MSRKPQRRNERRRKTTDTGAKRKAAATPHEKRQPSQRKRRNQKPDKSGFCSVPVTEIRESPENDRLYAPFDLANADDAELAADVAANGVRQPVDVSLDGYLISGHRRLNAARLAGLKTIPCRVHEISYGDATEDDWIRLLRDHNRQLEKTRDEQLREKLVDIDPEDAYQTLIEHRRQRSAVTTESFAIEGTKRRKSISPAKRFMVEAIVDIVKAREAFWPLSVRMVHYALLNDPPLRHASKPSSTYENGLRSYKDLSDLLTRLRQLRLISLGCIDDETRPVTIPDAFSSPAPFIERELSWFLKQFRRNLQQSQPHHIEIVAEKNTVASILRPVAEEYCIPLTIGRGFCSWPPRAWMNKRYRASGKRKLVVLILSDCDPSGDEIAQSFARSMRDEFGVHHIHPVRVALTPEQVVEFNLPPQMKAKRSSSVFKKFVKRHGTDDVYELEALPPERLQSLLRDAIDGVLDIEAFNQEVDAEREDAAHLQGVRECVVEALKGVDLGNGGAA